jgi:hypothetical protein
MDSFIKTGVTFLGLDPFRALFPICCQDALVLLIGISLLYISLIIISSLFRWVLFSLKMAFFIVSFYAIYQYLLFIKLIPDRKHCLLIFLEVKM